jgi:tetratricopeptide (TPR) repeat protein
MKCRKRRQTIVEIESDMARTQPAPAVSRRAYKVLGLLAGSTLLVAALWGLSASPDPVPAASAATVSGAQPAHYVGSQSCASCHATAWKDWMGSQHAKAMQHASPATVLGDFNNATFHYNGIGSTFFRRDGGFFVRTDGPDGKLHEYPIKFTFGVSPLQQYLIPMPGGRLQALSIAWDSRPKAKGGQRWFHLYQDQKITHNDVLHWTRPSHNWNRMCADCHSTNLEKHYDPVHRTYATTWSEINVSCEACHGPGSNHIAWATKAAGSEQFAKNLGLVINLNERDGVTWTTDPRTGTPVRSKPRTSDREISMCAHCHSRRLQISEGYVPGRPLLDYYVPSLLQDNLYFDDGQIKGEDYVYGSFVQSKMYAAGVTCSDCHQPHTMKLRLPGNSVCLQCHAAKQFDTPAHYHHRPGSPGASCVECHMPTRTYMVVDPRRDHSLRVPRPDLTLRFGTPNACNNCHKEKSAAWAAAHVKKWYGTQPTGFQTYARAFHAARLGEPGARRELAELIRDTQVPDIARATAINDLGRYLDASTLEVVQLVLSDKNPLVRASSVEALQRAPMEVRRRMLLPLLADPVRDVRIETARLLAGSPEDGLSADQKAALDKATAEFVHSQQINADWPQARVSLANLYAAEGKTEAAITAYTAANEINPSFVPAYVNLADLYRRLHQDSKGEEVLEKAIERVPNNATLHYALGLTLVRQQKIPPALEELRKAAALDSGSAQYSYTYAIALNSTGKGEEAIQLLKQAQRRFPYNREILSALVSLYRDRGDMGEARHYAEKLRLLEQ